MKKIVMLMLVMASMSVKVNAQWFVSGSAAFGYLNDQFVLDLRPTAGYEINDRWAVGLGIGMGIRSRDAFGVFDPYARFNCWNNSKFFVDVKGEAKFFFGSEWINANVGFVPSLRVAINDHWQVAGDFGLFGVQFFEDFARPAFGFTTTGAEISAIYKF